MELQGHFSPVQTMLMLGGCVGKGGILGCWVPKSTQRFFELPQAPWPLSMSCSPALPALAP